MNKSFLVAAAIYLALVISLTFPLALNMGNSLYSFPGDDLMGIQFVWWYKYSTQNGLNFGDFSYFSAPFSFNLATHPFPPYIIYLAGLIAIPTNPVFGYNLVTLLGIFLSAFSFFLLGKCLTKNSHAAFFLGFVGLLVSLRVSLGNPEMAQLQWIALCAFFLFRFWETNKVREIVAASIFFSLAALSSYYFVVILGLFVVFFFAVKFSGAAYRQELSLLTKSNCKRTLLFFALSFVFVLPFVFPMIPSILSPAGTDFGASETKTSLPLDWWQLLVYPAYHPLLGETAQNIMLEFGGKVTSNALEKGKFLGYSLILLSIAGIWVFLVKKEELSGSTHRRENVLLFWIAFFAALMFAFVPDFPLFRTNARFQTIMLFSLACLSCYTVAYLFWRTGSEKRKIVLTLALCAIVFLEFMPPVFQSTALEPVPLGYQWLSYQNGDFIIADYYPKEEISSDLWNSTISYFQTVHQKKLFPIMESSLQSAEANLAFEKAKNIESEEAGKTLAQYGVKYVIIHKSHYFSVPKYILGGNDAIKPISLENLPPNLQKVRDFGDATIFEVKRE